MDQIYKLQPHRTMHLQGFDAFGAAAALCGASDTGFSVSGVFRDQADFAIVVLFLKDDPFGHPRFSYLPDDNFTGITLDFDITRQGIRAFESKKSAWTDWPTLNCLKADNNTDNYPLMDPVTTVPTGRTGACLPVHGTLVGQIALPVSDGLVLLRLAVGARVPGRAPHRRPAAQVLGIRPPVLVWLVLAVADGDRPTGLPVNTFLLQRDCRGAD